MNKQNNANYKFRSKDFYDLLNAQEYRCAYSNRELTPQNTHAVHIIPLGQNGEHKLSNITLIDKDIYYLKKQLSPEQLFELAKDIIETMGKDYGYRLSKTRKR